MYIALKPLDFFDNGNFSIHRKKKDCPPNTSILRITKPCYLEVKFSYDEKTGPYSKEISKFKEKDLNVRKYGASFFNAPDDTSNKFEELKNGYKYFTTDFWGQPRLCRVLKITKEQLKEAKT